MSSHDGLARMANRSARFVRSDAQEAIAGTHDRIVSFWRGPACVTRGGR